MQFLDDMDVSTLDDDTFRVDDIKIEHSLDDKIHVHRIHHTDDDIFRVDDIKIEHSLDDKIHVHRIHHTDDDIFRDVTWDDIKIEHSFNGIIG